MLIAPVYAPINIYLITITCALLSTGLTGCGGDGPCQMEVETIDSLTLSRDLQNGPAYRPNDRFSTPVHELLRITDYEDQLSLLEIAAIGCE